jgi:hypothetical protein
LDLLAYKNSDDLIFDYDDEIIKDDTVLLNWVNELAWEDIKHLAEEVCRPQPEPNFEEEWKNCNKTIVNWDETLDILDFFEINDMIDLVTDQDDKPL